mmetsp:Transcript_31908/g.71858  ORF Transcript_31908/g.71858 Transcript_31908/m.71858 type:complete len:402 (-) Transcript_31908:1429-2634(-)
MGRGRSRIMKKKSSFPRPRRSGEPLIAKMRSPACTPWAAAVPSGSTAVTTMDAPPGSPPGCRELCARILESMWTSAKAEKLRPMGPGPNSTGASKGSYLAERARRIAKSVSSSHSSEVDPTSDPPPLDDRPDAPDAAEAADATDAAPDAPSVALPPLRLGPGLAPDEELEEEEASSPSLSLALGTTGDRSVTKPTPPPPEFPPPPVPGGCRGVKRSVALCGEERPSRSASSLARSRSGLLSSLDLASTEARLASSLATRLRSVSSLPSTPRRAAEPSPDTALPPDPRSPGSVLALEAPEPGPDPEREAGREARQEAGRGGCELGPNGAQRPRAAPRLGVPRVTKGRPALRIGGGGGGGHVGKDREGVKTLGALGALGRVGAGGKLGRPERVRRRGGVPGVP